jgi:hypothetical protein
MKRRRHIVCASSAIETLEVPLRTTYNRINSTKSPASGAGNFSEPRLMSEVGRMGEVMCACVSVFLQSERRRCQYSSAYVVPAVM